MSTAILLNQIPFFAGLSPQMLAPLQAACRTVKLEPEQILFHRGDRGREMYVVESGLVRVWIEAPDGRQLHLANLGPNEVLGELDMIDGKSRSASAQALERTRLIALPREALFDQLGNYPGMAIHLMAVLSQRLRRNNEIQFMMQGVRPPPARLAGMLILWANNNPSSYIDNFNLRETAYVLGVETGEIENILAGWVAGEIIEYVDNTTLIIRTPEQLYAAAGWGTVEAA